MGTRWLLYANTPVSFVPPHTPLLHSTNGAYTEADPGFLDRGFKLTMGGSILLFFLMSDFSENEITLPRRGVLGPPLNINFLILT